MDQLDLCQLQLSLQIAFMARNHINPTPLPPPPPLRTATVVLFCMAALIFPMGFYIKEVGGQPYKLPNNTVVGSSYVLFVLSIFFTIVGLLFAGKVCLPGWRLTWRNCWMWLTSGRAVLPAEPNKMDEHIFFFLEVRNVWKEAWREAPPPKSAIGPEVTQVELAMTASSALNNETDERRHTMTNGHKHPQLEGGLAKLSTRAETLTDLLERSWKWH